MTNILTIAKLAAMKEVFGELEELLKSGRGTDLIDSTPFWMYALYGSDSRVFDLTVKYCSVLAVCPSSRRCMKELAALPQFYEYDEDEEARRRAMINAKAEQEEMEDIMPAAPRRILSKSRL